MPLDPDEQGDYRANREIVENASAYEQMKADALAGRTFSNIVTEYITEFDPDHPLKIIGGQHRFEAIRLALDQGVDEYHGVKVYVGLNMEQRLDVQLISNTNIAISSDLFDRMQETVRGPELRKWCAAVGMLPKDHDFADRKVRGGAATVQFARTLITNYYLGMQVDPKKFDDTETTPVVCPRGQLDEAWEKLKGKNKDLWSNANLKEAGNQYSRLVAAQRDAFADKKGNKIPPDYPEKAGNMAVLAAWAYIAGVLQPNAQRLKRHYSLADVPGKDPLNAQALAGGKHKTDAENYRGLGYRVDPKERARFAELFYLQAEKGEGITKPLVDIAIKQYHAKQAKLEVEKAKAKGV